MNKFHEYFLINKKTSSLILLIILISICMSCQSFGTVNEDIVQGSPNPTKPTLEPSKVDELKDGKTDMLEKQFSVLKFGAVGNGTADDTQAIQHAIDAAFAAGGGTVIFPEGTYKVKIKNNNSHAISIHKNIILQGDINKKSIIKLANSQGNYDAIITGSRPDEDLSNFKIRNLTIDNNSSKNPVNSERDLSGTKFRYSIRIYAGKNIDIEDCKFIDINSTNVISVNNDTAVSDVLIKNNRFEEIGGGTFDHDHSTIYLHGKRGKVIDNVFLSRNGAGTYGARTAIEIHGDGHLVANNRIDGFTNGIFVTGYASSSQNQVIRKNDINNAYSGIVIWSYFFKNSKPNPAILNCKISNNDIKINVAGWRQLWGNSPSQGIALEPNSESSIDTVTIQNNTIKFLNNDAGRSSDTMANGIALWRYAKPKVKSYRIYINQNKIINSLSSGIYINMPISDLEINQNKIINPGVGKYAFSDVFRSGIILSKNQEFIKVNENQFLDNQPVNTMKSGMAWGLPCKSQCMRQANTIKVDSGANIPLIIEIPNP